MNHQSPRMAVAPGDFYFADPRPVDVTALRHPVCSLVIDAEEDFDWANPTYGTPYTTSCMRQARELQDIVSAYGVQPTYLLTYPVLDDPEVVRLLRRQIERGECDVGVQLHPWVNPPFLGDMDAHTSFLGSLTPEIEESKLLALKARFRQCFDRDPISFRAGRYGLGRDTSRLLEKHGFLVDTSLAPRTDFRPEHGPNFSSYDCTPFWFGEDRALLELPLCRSLIGWSGPAALPLYVALSTPTLSRWHVPGILSRLRCVERVTLSPEGNDEAAMLRFLRSRLAAGQRIFSLSFHSSSLALGRNPYVQTRADLHGFYDRLSGILDAMASRLGFGFVSLGEMPALLLKNVA
ncbi:MAG: hypothetical protein WDN25_05555 [Acetobacteraceae bacterium]